MNKTSTEENGFISISDEQLVLVSGGEPLNNPLPFNVICNYALALIQQIYQALLPSFNWQDKGANFMCLIHEWAEYHYGINGKNENDPKCQAIVAVLKANGFSIEKIKEIFKEAERRAA